ncbi:MAG: multiheme c-type cytochrome [Fuerstiella sp.]
MSTAPREHTAIRCRSVQISVASVLLISLRMSSIYAYSDVTLTPVLENSSVERGTSNLVGTNSCAAGSCHGGARLSEGRSFAAYRIWIQKGPHSMAYEVLNNERSNRMMTLLHATESGSPPHATKEARCLNCHVTTEVSDALDVQPAPHAMADGVGCESCHGPARKWIGLHTTGEWRGFSAETKKSFGFVDTTADLTGRIQLCVQCHVGGPGRDVSHDLIAAGHPRLNFEFSAFHANLPKHWNVHSQQAVDIKDVESDPAFEAKAWLTGQLLTAQASLRLLEQRTEELQSWPELSEYSCFSCHHDLKDDSWYRSEHRSKRKPLGRLSWGTWNYSTLPALTPDAEFKQQFESLKELLEGSFAKREEVRKQARSLDQVLDKVIRHQSNRDYSLRGLDQLALQMLKGVRRENIPYQSWDQTAQLYLATVAISLAREKSASGDLRNMSIRTDLEQIRKELLFEENEDSPREYSEHRIETILSRLSRIQETLATANPDARRP